MRHNGRRLRRVPRWLIAQENPTNDNQQRESFSSREARDARWRELRKGRRHVVRYSQSVQDNVRLANGKMVSGEVAYLVAYPRS